MAMRAFGRGLLRTTAAHRGTFAAARFQSAGPGTGQLPDAPPGLSPQDIAERLAAGRAALEKYMEENPEGEGVVKTNYALGELLLMKEDDASTAEALVHLTRAVRLQEKNDPNTEPLAKAYYLVGHVHVSAKDAESGLKCFKKSAEILEGLEKSDTVLTEVSKVWFIIGQLQVSMGLNDEGYAAFQKVFAAAKQGTTDADWEYMASLYRRVAMQFHRRQDLARAGELYGEALALSEQHAPRGEDTANLYYTLAQLRVASAPQDDPEKYHQALEGAQELCNKSLDIMEAAKPDDVETAALYNIISQIKHLLRDMPAALEAQLKASKILEEKETKSNLLSHSYAHLAMLHEDVGNKDDAAMYKAKAQEQEKTFQERVRQAQEAQQQ